MKHYITTREASLLSTLLEKVAKMVNASPVIAAMCYIDRHETQILEDIKKRIEK